MRPLMYFFVRPPVLAHTILHIFMSLVCISRTAGKPHHARKKSRSRILSQTALFPFAARLRAYDMYIGVYAINTHTLCGRTICWGIGQSCIKLPVYIYTAYRSFAYMFAVHKRDVSMCAQIFQCGVHTLRDIHFCARRPTLAQSISEPALMIWETDDDQPASQPEIPISHTATHQQQQSARSRARFFCHSGGIEFRAVARRNVSRLRRAIYIHIYIQVRIRRGDEWCAAGWW